MRRRSNGLRPARESRNPHPPDEPALIHRDETSDDLIAVWQAIYGRDVLTVCRYHGFRDHDAYDMSQETFRKALSALRRGTLVRDPLRWLKTVANSACKTERKRLAIARRFTRPLPNDLEACNAMTGEENRPELEELLEMLPLEDRAFMQLFLRKRSWSGLAGGLGLTVSQARHRAGRIIGYLKRLARRES